MPYGTPQPMFAGGNFPPPRRNRTALYVTLGAGAALLLVIGLVVSLVAFSGSDSKGSAGDMVTAYLEALSRGDAEAALSYSADQPASTDLLTDEILKQQIDEMPISNIRILSDDANGSVGMGTVHVTVNFGDKLSDATLMVQKKDGEWKLDSGTVRVDNTSMGGGYDGASSTLTAFGTPVGDSVFYVFPGFIEWGSDSDYIDVPSGDPLMLDALGVGGYVSMSSITYELSDSGQEAIRTAVDDALAVCAQSHAMEPPNCPQYLIQFDALDGTVNWTAPSTENAAITLNDYDMSATVDVDSNWGYSVRLRDGGTDRGTQAAFMYLTVDLTQDPLQVALN